MSKSVTKSYILPATKAGEEPSRPEITFNIPRLKLREMLSLEDEIIAKKEAVFRQLSAELKLDPGTVATILLDIRTTTPASGAVAAYCESMRGALSIIELSLKKAKLSPEMTELFMDEVPGPALMELARQLVYDVQEVPPPPANGEKDAKQTAADLALTQLKAENAAETKDDTRGELIHALQPEGQSATGGVRPLESSGASVPSSEVRATNLASQPGVQVSTGSVMPPVVKVRKKAKDILAGVAYLGQPEEADGE